MAYRFVSGSAHYVEFAIAPLVGHTFGPLTFAFLFKRASFGAASTLVTIDNSTLANVKEFLQIRAANNLRELSNATASDSAATLTSTTLWYLLAVTRASGTATPRFHIHDETSWTHQNGGASQAGSSITLAGDRLRVGQQDGGLAFFNGDIVCAGIKKADSADATIETLSRTAFSAWQAFAFDWLIGFDTSLTSGGVLQDQATPGTGDETAKTGTSVVADPPGWSWGGAAGPTFVPQTIVIT